MSLLVHGDDFVAVGRAAGRKLVSDLLRRHYEVKEKTLGPNAQAGESSELRILGRVVTQDMLN